MSRITAIVTAFTRLEQTLDTLSRLEHCRPEPAEILVHVDGNRHDVAAAIRRTHPRAGIIVSSSIVGPGGGRNALISAAAHSVVASFDDDSYPIDTDYFDRVATIMARVPDASVVAASVYHRHEAIGEACLSAEWVSDFSGGACVYRRDAFFATGGYVPVETAYGVEEVDLALRLHAAGRKVLHTPWLRVFHDTDLSRHADPRVTAASVANLALLTYLRYPVLLWPVGAAQCAKRLWWLFGHGRRRGMWRGLRDIPTLVRQHHRARQVVGATDLLSYLRRRHRAEPIELTAQ